MRSTWPIPVRALVAAGVVYALFGASVSYWFTRSTGISRWTMLPAGPAVSFTNLLAVNLATWCGWALLAAVVFWLGRRYPLGRAAWARPLAVHALASVGVVSLHIVLVATIRLVVQRRWGLDPSWWSSVVETFFRTIDLQVPVYFALLGLQHAVDYHREVRARDVAAAQVETRLVEAQLQALHRQVHPHFLFNTLHAISALVHNDPERADTMIERLSDMLRVTLASGGVQEVTLRQELDFLRAYLDIEQVHFGARLRVRLEVDPALLDVMVPSLVLQPLVENALRHGLAPRLAGGTLTVTAAQAFGDLMVMVCDDGCGVPDESTTTPGHGLGLTNTRARLAALYRDSASLTIASRTGGGTTVTVRVPCRAAEREDRSVWSRRAS